METKIYVFFFCLILLFSFASAIEFTIKDEVLRGENLVVKVSGDFIKPLTKDNIYFYRRHMSTSIEPHGIEKIDGDYYIYAQIPFEKEVDDYSIWLKNIEYSTGIGTSADDVFANFTILEGYASFSLNPGILQTTGNYFIDVENLKGSTFIVNYGESERTLIDLQENPVEKIGFLESLFGSNENESNGTTGESVSWSNSIELKPGEIKNIEFPIENFVGLKKIHFNYEFENYEVLVFMEGSEVVEIIEETGEETDNVEENETDNVEEGSKEEGEEITNTEEEGEELEEVDEAAFAESCEALNGSICEKGFKCEGEKEYTKTSICCMGQCIENTKSSTGKTIGWVLIIAIVLFLTWFFKNKYRGTTPPKVDLEKVSRGKRK